MYSTINAMGFSLVFIGWAFRSTLHPKVKQIENYAVRWTEERTFFLEPTSHQTDENDVLLHIGKHISKKKKKKGNMGGGGVCPPPEGLWR